MPQRPLDYRPPRDEPPPRRRWWQFRSEYGGGCLLGVILTLVVTAASHALYVQSLRKRFLTPAPVTAPAPARRSTSPYHPCNLLRLQTAPTGGPVTSPA